MRFLGLGALLVATIGLSGCGDSDSGSPLGVRSFETGRRALSPILVNGVQFRRVEITSEFDNGEVYIDEFVFVNGRRIRCGGDCAAAVLAALESPEDDDSSSSGSGSGGTVGN